MCKNWKHLLLMLLAVCLLLTCAATAAAQQDIIDLEQTLPSEVEGEYQEHFDLTTVTRGTFSMENTVRAELYYPLSQQVRVEYSGAVLEEYLVSKKAVVKAGDPLARIRVETDPVTLARMELNLQQAEDSFAQEVSRREDSIAEQKRIAAKEEDPLAREILELEIRRSELTLEQYRYRQEYSLQSQRDQVAQYKADATVTTIFSPVDGIVTEREMIKAGSELYNGQVLFTISDTADVLLYLESVPSAYFGSTVTVTFAGEEKDFTLTGTAVATASLEKIPEPPDSRRSYCYVRLDSFDPTAEFLNIRASVPIIQCHDVLLAPNNAVVWEDGYGYYVMKMIDDTPVKTRVEVSYISEDHAMILGGVEEGDVLVNG